MRVWKWFVEFIFGTDEGVKDGTIESKDSWGAGWMAEFNLQARLHHPSSPDIPGLPKGAMITHYGTKVVEKEE